MNDYSSISDRIITERLELVNIPRHIMMSFSVLERSDRCHIEGDKIVLDYDNAYVEYAIIDKDVSLKAYEGIFLQAKLK